MTRRLMALGVCALVALAACGGSSSKDSQTADGKKYVDALIASYNKEKAAGGAGVPYTDTQIKCLSEKLVDAIGVDTLEKNGITPPKAGGNVGIEKLGKKLPVDTRVKIGQAFLDRGCYDPTNELTTQFKESMGAQPAGAAQCMAKEVAGIRAFQQFVGDSSVGIDAGTPFTGEVGKALQPAFKKCHVDQSKLEG